MYIGPLDYSSSQRSTMESSMMTRSSSSTKGSTVLNLPKITSTKTEKQFMKTETIIDENDDDDDEKKSANEENDDEEEDEDSGQDQDANASIVIVPLKSDVKLTTTTTTTTEIPMTTTRSIDTMSTTKTLNKKKKKLNTNSVNNRNNSRTNSSHQHRKKSKSRTRTTTTTTTMKPSLEIMEMNSSNDDLIANRTCLIGDVCGQKQMGYCYRPHEPKYFDLSDIDTENFYDLLLTSCPHFFDEEENLRHPLCCTVEMEDTMAKLIMSVDLIQRSCPSCLTNVKKLFCNLFCAPNQRDFVKVNHLKGEMVLEVSYVLSELFAEKFYQSCHDVQVFGAYLMDFDSACGNLTRKRCTAKDFLEHLGSLQEIPFRFRPIIISDNDPNSSLMATKKGPEDWPRYIMNETAYACDEAPPGLSTCRCDHCANMCLYGQYNPHSKNKQQSSMDLEQDDNVQQPNRIGRQTMDRSSKSMAMANSNNRNRYSSIANSSLMMPKCHLSLLLLLYLVFILL
ncbi:NPC intracellular cholesterol transporter 1 [Dermatophagoides pteronyssinus]|uniref:NPC intracellular cholesterol transporter 1 n=1 Tax=Dermatophagoides pteronyssinus TaxID=6956 RepID=A0ABQ8JBD0_DERPT|nr:NPC intracellular cholesterol transporter 1 [Dermatophagoides pteronyssinus]